MKQDYELLKRVLSVPTKTYKEDMMIEFLTSWLVENDIPHFIDNMGNIYATKQSDEAAKWVCGYITSKVSVYLSFIENICQIQ